MDRETVSKPVYKDMKPSTLNNLVSPTIRKKLVNDRIAPFKRYGGSMKFLEDFDTDLISAYEKERFNDHYMVFKSGYFQRDDLKTMKLEEISEKIQYYKDNLAEQFQDNKNLNSTKEGNDVSELFVALRETHDQYHALSFRLYNKLQELLVNQNFELGRVKTAVKMILGRCETLSELEYLSKDFDKMVQEAVSYLYIGKSEELFILQSANEYNHVRIEDLKARLNPEYVEYLETLALESWLVDNQLPSRTSRSIEFFLKPNDHLGQLIKLGINENAILCVSLDKDKITKYPEKTGEESLSKLPGMSPFYRYKVASEQAVIRDVISYPLKLQSGVQVVIDLDIYLSWQKLNF